MSNCRRSPFYKSPRAIITATLPEQPSRRGFFDRTALVDGDGAWSYGDLLRHADRFRDLFLARSGVAPGATLAGERVAFLVPPGRMHVAVQWGVWRAGGIAAPLALSHPRRELEYVLDDAKPCIVVADPALEHADALLRAADSRGAEAVWLGKVDATSSLGLSSSGLPSPGLPSPGVPSAGRSAGPCPTPDPGDGALIIYTSGTTGRPKGALSTHANVAAQCRSLVAAWGWSHDDRILHVLPLHHVHGIVNALCCALWSGAACEFGAPAPAAVWERLAAGGITLFMAVPTTYGRLIRAWEEAPADLQRRWARGARELRLMVSGSAALPVAVFRRWQEITGQVLLERYGATEIGMALSNPLAGERRPGGVGQPLPEVEVRLVDGDGRPAVGDSGQLAVRGPHVFKGYWGRPEETAAAFRDGWYLTGDEARLEDGGWRILGRRSVDILKTGGYKVSALEVEELYREHPAVQDVAVVGAPDAEWGQRVCAAWTPSARAAASAAGAYPTNAQLRAWGKERLAPYKVPRDFRMVERLPRNAMGKVRKAEVVSIFNASSDASPCSDASPSPAG